MTRYSNSRIGSFEQCRLKYKFQYIDRVKVKYPDTVETFMGSRVHDALEGVYAHVMKGDVPTLENIISDYSDAWGKKWTDSVIIAKAGMRMEDYLKTGEKCLSEYYKNYAPFDSEVTLDLETNDLLKLPDGNEWYVRIDRLAKRGDTLIVCDYKTSSRMINQASADKDRQLGMYGKWAHEKFPEAKEIELRWEMLKFASAVTSKRTEDELATHVRTVVSKIKEIEGCIEFPKCEGPLCNYCLFKDVCAQYSPPKGGHDIAILTQTKPPMYQKNRVHPQRGSRQATLSTFF